MNITQTYDVVGMTCDHCARSVENEIRKIKGVDDVTVDLVSGLVTVESVGDLVAAEVASAVVEAGYELAS